MSSVSLQDKENPVSTVPAGKSTPGLVGAKRGLQSRSRSGSVDTGVNSMNAPASQQKMKKAKRSGIPVPKAGMAGQASAAKKKLPRTPGTRTPHANNSLSISSLSRVSGMKDVLGEHGALLDELLAAVRNKPDTKGMSKTAYKSRMVAFEKGYKMLRTAAGEYQKKARVHMDRIASIEKQLVDDHCRSTAETEQLRSSCESLEQEMESSKAQLANLKAERSQMQKCNQDLEAKVLTLNGQVQALESQVLEHKGANATLTAKSDALQIRLDEYSSKLETANQQHRSDLERVKNELTERHEIKINAVTIRCNDLQKSLQSKSNELSASQSSAASLKAKVEAAEASLTKVKAELAEKMAKLQEHAISDVKNEAQIAHLKSSLESKEREMERTMEGSRHTQQMSERRAEELLAEKKMLVSKVDALEISRREAESTATELREKLNTMSRDLDARTERVSALETSESTLQKQLAEQTARAGVAEERASSFEEKFTTTKTTLDTTLSEKSTLETAHATLQVSSKADKERLENQLNTMTSKAESAEAGLAEATKRCSELETEKVALQGAAGSSAQEQLEKVMKLSVENDALKKRLGADQGVDLLGLAQERVRELEARIFETEAARRRLHNKVQELRGNVRVAVRVRPLMGKEIEAEDPALAASGGAIRCAGGADSMDLALVSGPGAGKKMSFDKVFGPKSDQTKVFEEVSELVQSALDGFSVCIFTYGQTGSGKTYTMQGGTEGESRGIIPRAIEQILNTSQRMGDDGWNFTIKASFLEIYNEEINDLLSSKKTLSKQPKKEGFMSKGARSSTTDSNAIKYNIRQVGAGMVVDNLTEVNLTNFGQLQGIVDRAAKNRSVAATDMNAQSSRSHCCFVLHISGVNEARNTKVQGCLNLVDLAGSERLARSGATGDRAKETAAINKSLSALVDVFDALARKRSHVPFRNSKLTYLMQGCLSGNGKTMMIVNVSPTTESGGETLCSLRFAKQVNQTELGRAKAQKSSASASRAPSAPSTAHLKRSRLPTGSGINNRMAKRQKSR